MNANVDRSPSHAAAAARVGWGGRLGTPGAQVLADRVAACGFRLEHTDQATVLWHRDAEAQFSRLAELPVEDFLAGLAKEQLDAAGRGGATRLVLSDQLSAVHIRRRRGGLLGGLLGDRYYFGGRFEQDLMVELDVASADIPAPRLLAASRRSNGRLATRLDFFYEEVPGARDALVFLREQRQVLGAGEYRALKKKLARSAGRIVGRLHAARILHPDLHPRNFMVVGEPGQFRLLLSDFKLNHAGAVYPANALGFRWNLRRLHRGLDKMLIGEGLMGREEIRPFLVGYLRDCPLMRGELPAEPRHLLHVWKWKRLLSQERFAG